MVLSVDVAKIDNYFFIAANGEHKANIFYTDNNKIYNNLFTEKVIDKIPPLYMSMGLDMFNNDDWVQILNEIDYFKNF